LWICLVTGLWMVTSGCASAPTPGLVVIPEDQRVAAAVIAGPDLRGGVLSSAQFMGRPMVVNAFASWCKPCQEELPLLAQMHGDGLMVLGLDVQDVAEAAIGTLAAVEAEFPVITDPSGEVLAILRTPSTGIPQSVLIDAQGRVAGYVIGPMDEDLAASVRKLLS
jgi:thiol-disulfide isomerase/thioredoxin